MIGRSSHTAPRLLGVFCQPPPLDSRLWYPVPSQVAARKDRVAENWPTSLATLGMLYRDQNKRTDAYAALNRAAAIHERTTRPDDPDVAITLVYLGDMLTTDARYQEAERQYRRALVKVTKTAGPDHEYAGVIAFSLAKMFRAQGKREDAERFDRQGLAVMEQRMGRGNPNLGGYLRDYADFLQTTNRENEASALRSRADALEVADRGARP